jgi:hypothetical protein
MKLFPCLQNIIKPKMIVALILFAVLAFSNTAVPNQPTRAYQIKVNAANQVEMSVSNYGKYGQNEQGWYGAWWPKGSGHPVNLSMCPDSLICQ